MQFCQAEWSKIKLVENPKLSQALRSVTFGSHKNVQIWVCISYPIGPDSFAIKQHISNSGKSFTNLNTRGRRWRWQNIFTFTLIAVTQIHVASKVRPTPTPHVHICHWCYHLPMCHSATSKTNQPSLWVAHFPPSPPKGSTLPLRWSIEASTTIHSAEWVYQRGLQQKCS